MNIYSICQCNVTSFHFCPQVEPAPANNNLSRLVVGNNSEFNQLVQSGNVKVATQLANAVLQTVEQSNTTAIQEKIAVGTLNIILILWRGICSE